MLKRTLLVVEDDSLVAWALQKAAVSVRVPVRVAGTAAEALTALRQEPCDLAFVDVRLPDGDGIELVHELRALAPDIKVVVITADNTAANRERAYLCGAWHFLEKPFEFGDITRVIEDCFSANPGRRLYERRLCQLAVRLEMTEDEAVVTRSFEATAVDISHGGLRLATDYPLQPGQQIRVRPHQGPSGIEDGFRRDAMARVIWTRASEHGVTAGLAYMS
jgi:DNA-binding NtrC family response regulator